MNLKLFKNTNDKVKVGSNDLVGPEHLWTFPLDSSRITYKLFKETSGSVRYIPIPRGSSAGGRVIGSL